MPKFVAITSPGLTEPLMEELKGLGLQKLKANPRSVEFEGNWEMCYRANLGSALATRILLPVLEFPAYKPEDIYFAPSRESPHFDIALKSRRHFSEIVHLLLNER